MTTHLTNIHTKSCCFSNASSQGIISLFPSLWVIKALLNICWSHFDRAGLPLKKTKRDHTFSNAQGYWEAFAKLAIQSLQNEKAHTVLSAKEERCSEITKLSSQFHTRMKLLVAFATFHVIISLLAASMMSHAPKQWMKQIFTKRLIQLYSQSGCTWRDLVSCKHLKW